MNGSNLNEDERKKNQFDTWLLHLPPINLWNVELIYLAFGYDQRWDIKEKYGSSYGDPGRTSETGN